MTKTQCLVVIVSYRNANLTIESVEAASRQTIPTRVVLWDNNSPDDSATRLSAHQFPENVCVELHPKNLLWTPALNRAVERFWDGEPYLCFLNNDLVIPENTLERLIAVFDEHPDAGMVGPMGSGIGGPQDYATHFKNWALEGNLGGEPAFRARPAYRCPFLIGCAVMLPYSVWSDVGPLDESMPLGADDHDYALRVKHSGRTIWVHPGTYVRHRCHATGDSPEWDEWGGKSWQAFDAKWDGYFVTEGEANNCHWGGVYVPGFDRGTGWDEATYKERVG